MVFPVSGVEVNPLIPPLIALVVSTFTSMGGVSGAFLLLPFQVSILNFTSPSVSPTNLVFNIVAIPSGVYRFIREGRMNWPVTWVVILGTLPGLFFGALIRINWMLDPKEHFKLFVGCVLLYIGLRLLYEQTPGAKAKKAKILEFEAQVQERLKKVLAESGHTTGRGLPPAARVKTVSWSLRRVSYEFLGETFTFNAPALFILALVVGLIGGTYGIGGGAIIAPFLAAIFELPIYTIAGAGSDGHLPHLGGRGGLLFRDGALLPQYRAWPRTGPWGRCSASAASAACTSGPASRNSSPARSSASAWGWSSRAWPCATSWGSF